jgi:hypothetical protein
VADEDPGHTVNMTAKELEDWLQTDESKAAGQGSGESTGHKSGRRIVEILRKDKGDRTDSDVEHLEEVDGYNARHLKQRPDHPKDELRDMKWTHSLKNWGHDPLK